ncbi:hypothetical protein [Streptomyces sp. NPDC050560]|uniref:hypothetical protein n=1 Tax=Streptomyces sp. NPDC050560 TaxID=3365630 RepID=UPI0037956CB1
MSRAERREAAVRTLLDAGGPAAVPPGLGDAAARRGERLLRRRRAARRVLFALLCLAAVAFAVWALWARPWEGPPPSDVTPPLTGW